MTYCCQYWQILAVARFRPDLQCGNCKQFPESRKNLTPASECETARILDNYNLFGETSQLNNLRHALHGKSETKAGTGYALTKDVPTMKKTYCRRPDCRKYYGYRAVVNPKWRGALTNIRATDEPSKEKCRLSACDLHQPLQRWEYMPTPVPGAIKTEQSA